jgi:hypothetical protein
MELRTITYQRPIDYLVDAGRALELRQRGLTLPQIKDALGTSASLPTISRAIARAAAEGKS